MPKAWALRAAAGRLLLRPWIDGLTLKGIVGWYLPISRAWASAVGARGSAADFLDGISPARTSSSAVRRLIDLVEPKAGALRDATAEWEEAFFGTIGPGELALAAAERRRLAAAEALMLARRHFLGLHLMRHLPPVKWAIGDPAAVAAQHGKRLRNPEAAFPPLLGLPVEASRAVPGSHGRVSWLRMASPLGDLAWARVIAPAESADPPTLLYLHGVTIEAEMWRDDADPVAALARAGVRVIRAEAPWHGRRRPDDRYSGEPVLAQGPMGLLDFFAAWVSEVSAWIAWARHTSRGPVAIAGISLGALTCQIVLTAAHNWPQAQRPDGALLMAASGDSLASGYDGALARALGLRERLMELGWDRAEIARWRPLLEPAGPPAVAPERVLMLLGRADRVTPFRSGCALAQDWGLPEPNVMVRDQGHFTLDLSLMADPGPLHALARLLRGL